MNGPNKFFIFGIATLILFSSAQSLEKSTRNINESLSGKLLWSGNLLVFTSRPDSGVGFGLQGEYFLTEHFSLAGLVAIGAGGLPPFFGTGSTAFIYTVKGSFAFLGSKGLFYPYVGYGIGRADITDNVIYNIPAYYADAHYPLVGLAGVFGIVNSHLEVDMLTVFEKGHVKSAQLWNFGVGFTF